MADPAETDAEVEDQPPPKKDWRKELEDRAHNAESQLVEANTRLAFYDAELGHLSDEQREDVLTIAKSKGQTSAEDLKSIASRLSYAKPAAPAPTETAAPAPETNGHVDAMAQFGSGGQSNEAPPSAQAEFDRQVREFKGSKEEYENFLRANAHRLARD